MKEISVHIFYWFIFTVAFSLLPLGGYFLAMQLHGYSPTLFELLEKGELFSICCALAATGIGEAISIKRNRKYTHPCVAFCVLIVGAGIIGFVQRMMDIHNQVQLDERGQFFVVQFSIILFVATTFGAACCAVVSHEK